MQFIVPESQMAKGPVKLTLSSISSGKNFKVMVQYGREGFVTEEEKEASDEFDDEYLPACCRNGRPHTHPV